MLFSKQKGFLTAYAVWKPFYWLDLLVHAIHQDNALLHGARIGG